MRAITASIAYCGGWRKRGRTFQPIGWAIFTSTTANLPCWLRRSDESCIQRVSKGKMRQRHGSRWARHMRIFAALIVFVTLAVSVLSACGEAERGTSAQSLRRVAPAPTASVRAAQRTIWRPARGLSWQWQLEGNVDAGVDVAMYDIDLAAETSDGTSVAELVRRLHGQGKKVACYINVGAWENWRRS